MLWIHKDAAITTENGTQLLDLDSRSRWGRIKVDSTSRSSNNGRPCRCSVRGASLHALKRVELPGNFRVESALLR